ncbi:hypothetical protein NPIL_381591, partial [Nephila pilipes]
MRDDNYIFLWDAMTNDWNIGDTARVINLPTKLNGNPKHIPCGSMNRWAPYMRDGQCAKNYLRQFIDNTQSGHDSYGKRKLEIEDFTAG